MLLAAFLVTHGLLHLAIWLPAPSSTAPFDPRRSWALPGHGPVPLAELTALLYVAAGVTVAATPAIAIAAAVAGLALKVLWFHPWLLLGIAIDLAVIGAAVQ